MPLRQTSPWLRRRMHRSMAAGHRPRILPSGARERRALLVSEDKGGEATGGMGTSSYQLLDTGNGAKLEQVGPYRLVRPAPQALWCPASPSEVWDTAAACYHRSSTGGGAWTSRHTLPPTWVVTYCDLTLQVRLTDFGHLGFFAEYGPHWQWVHQYIHTADRPVRLLNTFAYTGGISLAAAAAGASVVHLDAAEGIVAWARDNAQLSGLTEARIRWVVEDVTKFLTREMRRGNKYDAIVLDPPSFGRGSKGEVWKLERDLPAILALCSQVLSDEPLCVLLSAHTPGVTPFVLAHLLADMLGNHRGLVTSMEMVIPHSVGTRVLPSGALARWSRD